MEFDDARCIEAAEEVRAVTSSLRFWFADMEILVDNWDARASAGWWTLAQCTSLLYPLRFHFPGGAGI